MGIAVKYPVLEERGTGDMRAQRAEQLLARSATLGDRDAFAELVDRVGPALYRYSLRMVCDPTEAEDCVQEALTRAWAGLGTYRAEARVRTWLFGIQANVVRHHLRRCRPVPMDDEQFDVLAGTTAGRGRSTAVGMADPGTPEQYALAGSLRATLDAALGELPASQREAWLLVVVEQLSYAEAAQVQHTTVTALRGCIERARRTLERRLAAWW